jgi:transcriptional regulator with GAF, ATPase, and Fis domain
MEQFVPFLLSVWRAVCRQTDIGQGLARAAPLLAGHLPADLVLVRTLDVQRGCVETVAAESLGPGSLPRCTRNEHAPAEMEQLLAWCRGDEVLRGPARGDDGLCRRLLPAPLEGEVLAGPLNPTQGFPGVLLLVARPPRTIGPGHEPLFAALLEPFAVALGNDRRVHELKALREAVEADNRSLLSRLGRHDISGSIVGAETGLRAVMQQVGLVAPSDAPVLILGETGSGKEVVARAIHTRSRRAAGPFLRVNCGAIPPELIDSELFGHERGSFTGAVGLRTGWFERADGGTLFLDECGELPAAAQVRLLRILQDGSFERVGGERQLSVDVRIVAATHRDLRSMVVEGRFREDLWYRLAVFPIQLPALRQRPEDIPALAAHFALQAARRLGAPPLVPARADLDLLLAYPWPGNVRELAAVIERAAILGDGKRLEVAQALGPVPLGGATRAVGTVLAGPHPAPAGEFLTLDALVVCHVEAALARTRGRIEGPDGAAALLGINPHTLRARMRKLGIDWQRHRPPRRRCGEGGGEAGTERAAA